MTRINRGKRSPQAQVRSARRQKQTERQLLVEAWRAENGD